MVTLDIPHLPYIPLFVASVIDRIESGLTVADCIKYGRYVARHKAFVAAECWKMGLYWRGLVHDWSKLLPDEFFPYAYHFVTRKRTGAKGPDPDYDRAWLKHQHRSDHHPQHHLLKKDDGSMKPLEMPMQTRKEMWADWTGAGKAQGHGNDTKEWWEKNKAKIILAPETLAWVEARIESMP